MATTIVKPSVNSNDTVFQLTEEQTLKVPYTGAQLLWFFMAVNSFKDFGGKVSTVARSTINNSRQQQKGTVTGVEATAGFNVDLCQHNLLRLHQAAFYCNAFTRALCSNVADINAVDTSTQPGVNPACAAGTLGTAAALPNGYFAVGTMLSFTGWTNSANNGLKVVTTTTTAGATAVTPATVVEANAPTSAQRVRVVGFQFAAADLALTLVGNDIKLTSTAAAWANIAPIIGEWLFVGGDAVGTQFGTNAPFWVRVSYVDPANGYILCDMSTGTQLADNGAAKTIQVFAGTRYVNSNIRRTYTMSRIYPQYQESTGGAVTSYANAEHVPGCVPNTFTLNIKQKSKIDIDFDFVGMDGLYDGKGLPASGVPYTTGKFIQETVEDCYNTSQSVYMMRLSILDPNTINPTPYFAYCTDATLDIKNNVTPNDAIGLVGAFDASVGSFDVDAKITAYFASVHALAAMRRNMSVGLQIIGAQDNSGFVYDLPLMTLSGSLPTVDKDKPVTLDLSGMGAMNANGYTLMAYFFDYLPNIAMPN